MQKFEQIPVRLTLESIVIVGRVTVKGGSYHARLSDMINSERQFIPLTDVEVYRQNKLIERTRFLCVNKQSIITFAEIIEHRQEAALESSAAQVSA